MIYYEKDLHIIEVKDGGLQFSGHFQLDLVNQFESIQLKLLNWSIEKSFLYDLSVL